MKVTSVVSNSLGPCGQKPTRLLCPWNFPGKNTGVDCHFLLQQIFPTQDQPESFASPALAGGALALRRLGPNMKHDESQSQLVKKYIAPTMKSWERQ